jgi:hypothetical protein
MSERRPQAAFTSSSSLYDARALVRADFGKDILMRKSTELRNHAAAQGQFRRSRS